MSNFSDNLPVCYAIAVEQKESRLNSFFVTSVIYIKIFDLLLYCVFYLEH